MNATKQTFLHDMKATKQTFLHKWFKNPTYEELMGLASNDDVVIKRFRDEGLTEFAILVTRILVLNFFKNEGLTFEHENGDEINLPSMSETLCGLEFGHFKGTSFKDFLTCLGRLPEMNSLKESFLQR